MTEVESLCDRIAILNEGEIVFEGTVSELGAKIGKRYAIQIITAQGEENVESENIGDTMLDLLEEYKQRNIAVLDIKIGRGTLEQHSIDMARGNGQ